jgi:hypothetical protein
VRAYMQGYKATKNWAAAAGAYRKAGMLYVSCIYGRRHVVFDNTFCLYRLKRNRTMRRRRPLSNALVVTSKPATAEQLHR